MSKFYARFKETKEEIIAFPTEQQRDNWVNFQDEFSRVFNNTAENATFQRMALTENQARYIIKNLGLVKTTIRDFPGETVTLFVPN